MSKFTGSKALISSLSTERQIGSGNHASCYKHPANRNKVLLETICPARDFLAARKVPMSRYFPTPRRVGKSAGNIPVYEMEKLELITEVVYEKLPPIDKKIFRLLSGGVKMYNLRSSGVPEPIKKEIKLVVAALRRQGYYVALDATDFNMMMSRNKRLVLNDIFWVNEE